MVSIIDGRHRCITAELHYRIEIFFGLGFRVLGYVGSSVLPFILNRRKVTFHSSIQFYNTIEVWFNINSDFDPACGTHPLPTEHAGHRQCLPPCMHNTPLNGMS